MAKYKLKKTVLSVNTLSGLVRDHSKVLTEKDFPEKRAEELVKKGFLEKVETKPKAKKEEK